MSVKLAENPRTAQNATIKRATAIAQRDIERLDAKTTQDLIAIYKRAAADVQGRIIAHAGADDNLNLQELRNVLDQVNARLRDLGHARDQLLSSSLERAADLGTEPFSGSALSASASIQISNDALQFVRNFVAEDGLQLSDRIWRTDRQARDQVVNAIESAVIQGQGAAQAAAELRAQGRPVPGDIQGKISAANAKSIGRNVGNVLTGDESAMQNAMRLFRTEINRAHGEAFMNGGEQVADFGGFRYKLSPAHPKPDICDLLSSQNLYGLGPGVYPTRAKTPWPAHPNTISFLEIVFKDEISDADRAGKETSLQALQRLSAKQQIGVLGKNKFDVLQAGKLAAGMIRAPWKSVSRRIGQVVVKPVEAVAAVTRKAADGMATAMSWLKSNVAARVSLPGATVAQVQSIRRAFEDVLVPFGVRIGSLGFSKSSDRFNGVFRYFRRSHNPGVNDTIEFNPEYAAKALEKAKHSNSVHTARTTAEAARLTALLEDPTLTKSQRTTIRGKLNQVQAAKRWSWSSQSEDPLYTTAAHEAGHALYFSSPRIEQTWRRELKALKVSRVDMLTVSEYAGTNVDELWAEVTAAIALGRRTEIPAKIRTAYDAALKERKP